MSIFDKYRISHYSNLRKRKDNSVKKHVTKMRFPTEIAADIIISKSDNYILSYYARMRLVDDEIDIIKQRKEG